MDYWNGGMLYRTYLIIQHVLYSEQWALRCVFLHALLDGWLDRLVLHCMNFDHGHDTPLLSGACKATTTVCLTLDYRLSFFLFHILYENNQMVYPGLGQSSKFIQCSTSLSSQPSSQQCMQRTQRRAHCSLYNTCWM